MEKSPGSLVSSEEESYVRKNSRRVHHGLVQT